MKLQQIHTQVCPKCQYKRQDSDVAPQWQCPKCGVAYMKAQGSKNSETMDVVTKKTKVINQYGGSRVYHRIFTSLVIFSLIILLIAWWQKSELPDAAEILPAMLNEPVQKNLDRKILFLHIVVKNTMSYRLRNMNYGVW